MDQIVVTIEEGTNISIIRNAIKMIKGVKNAIVSHIDTDHAQTKTDSRLKAFEKLAGSVSMDKIDTEDERTKYLLSK